MASQTTSRAYLWRRNNPGRVLDNALRRFEDRVMELMREAGHSQIRLPHVNLTRHLDLEGTRITELAKRAAMTNAAMTELIDQCEALGLVRRAPDPADKRARVVTFTPAGKKWLDTFGEAVALAQQEMAEEIGKQSMASLLGDIARYAAAMETSSV